MLSDMSHYAGIMQGRQRDDCRNWYLCMVLQYAASLSVGCMFWVE